MPTVRYTSVNGEILAEKRGGVRRAYVPDTLGSTAALLNTSQAKTDTFTYWPYGEEKSSSGSTPTPFRFVGTQGYYRDTSSRSYVRARHYQPGYGRWMTVDPLTYGLVWFQYSNNSPMNYVDPEGLLAIGPTIGRCGIAGALILAWGLACAECAGKIKDEIGKLDPPQGSQGFDKFQHCLSNCLINRTCDVACSILAISATEYGGYFDWLDMLANTAGVNCGIIALAPGLIFGNRKVCEVCCDPLGTIRHRLRRS